MEKIPAHLTSDYIIHNETIKYGTFDDEEFEKDIKNEDITENILINNIKQLESSIDKLKDEFIDLIKTNKLKFNEYLKKFDMKGLEYLVVYKATKSILKEIRIKLGDSDQEEEVNFDDYIKEYRTGEFKELLEDQLTENSAEYNELKAKLIDYINKIKNWKEKVGLIHLNLMVKYINIYTNKIIKKIEGVSELQKKKSENENHMLSILVLMKRVLTFPFSILNSFLLSSKDICNIPEKSKEWEDIKKITFRVNSKEDDKIKELLKNGNESQSYILSVFYDSFTQKNAVKKVFTAINHGIYLKLNKEAKEIHFKKARLNFNPKLIVEVLKMNKNKILKKLMVQTYPSVTFRKKLYLKKEYKEINLDYINELLNFLNGKISSKTEKRLPENLIEMSEENKPKPLYYEKIEKLEKKNYVSTRLFNYSEILFKKDADKKKSLIKSLNVFSNKNNQVTNSDTLFIHIHGGAYIASSTFQQEDYLREWCKKLEMPFLGIDYGLSPAHKYPEPLNDCFQAYMWILKNAKEELNMDIKNIIISGDSAGAIMVLSLTFLLITINQYENVNIKLPDLILIEYPTTYCGEDNVTNSLILSIKDLVFDPIFLKYVRDCYVGNYNNMEDPFLNPIKADEKILKYLPRTRIFFGSTDPLRDDSIRILYPISKVQGIDVRGYEFYNYWHAFNGVTPKPLRKMPWDFVFTEVEEFLKDQREGKK